MAFVLLMSISFVIYNKNMVLNVLKKFILFFFLLYAFDILFDIFWAVIMQEEISVNKIINSYLAEPKFFRKAIFAAILAYFFERIRSL